MAIGDYTDQQVKDWMQGKTTEEVAAKAASLNLNPSQIQNAYSMVGKNYSTNDIQDYASKRGYKWDQGGGLNFRTPQAAEAYADSQRGQVGGRLHDFVTNRNIYLGNETDANAGITPAQVKQWFAQNPNWTPEQIGQLASKYHMTPENVAQAISIGTGADYNPQKVRDWIGNQSAFRIENDGMISAPGRRSNGFNGSADGRRFGQYGPDGNGYADGVDPALGDSANFAPLGNTTPGTGQVGPTGVGGTSIWSATTGPGVWNVTPEQTVESRVAGILAGGNPLVAQRRAQADRRMNARGLLNSSIAQTASDEAAMSAALDIARPDAATYADAAKTNAGARTAWNISQSGQQTSKDIAAMNIAAQKELQQATQLYNNLTTQTASATSIQNWGLNTIATIQMSDLSAEAKTAAIKSIQQYLADSYMIQGDWHTSAAQAISAIFD